MINLLISTNNCADYALANILNTIHKIINMVAIIVPILLIISIIFSLVGFLVNVEQKNKGKKIIQKVAAAIIIFFLPTIVDTTMSLLDYAGGNIGKNNFQVASCWNLASKTQTSAPTYISGAGTFSKSSSKNSIAQELSGLKNYSNSNSNSIPKGNVKKLLKAAKEVTDYVRKNNFSYGNAPINPAINHDAKLTSCDRCVGWFLYKIGYTDQPKEQGLVVYSTGSKDLSKYLKKHGFTKITNKNKLKAGDIMFVNPNSSGHPGHTFLLGNKVSDGIWERYDCGSGDRIRSNQPFKEPVNNFMYAYRMPNS